MSAETHLSELCRGSDIDAIITRLRQVAPLDELQASDNAPSSNGASSSSHPDRHGLWGYQDSDGRTALHWAVALKNFDLARVLMNPPYNSPVLTEDEEWATPFATACSVGAPVELLQELLDRSMAELGEYLDWKAEHFSSPNEVRPATDTSAALVKPPGDTNGKKGGTPAQRRVRGVSKPADATTESAMSSIVNSEDATGLTPLLFAAGRGHLNIARFLVEHGGDLNKQNDRGQSALHRAVNRGNMDLVEYLVTASQKKNGTNKAAQRRFLDLQDCHGDSALFYASMDNNEEIGRYLLRRGADRELRNKDGKNFWEV
jgi:ankyrin repeat protein